MFRADEDGAINGVCYCSVSRSTHLLLYRPCSLQGGSLVVTPLQVAPSDAVLLVHIINDGVSHHEGAAQRVVLYNIGTACGRTMLIMLSCFSPDTKWRASYEE